jgi:hypothetical protein
MMIRPKTEIPPDTEDATPAPGADALDAITFDDVEGEGAPEKAEPAPGMGNAENLEMALKMAKALLTPMFAFWPQFDQVWSDSQVERIAGAGGAVCDKHGWDFGGALGQYGPYIALAAATAPPVMATAMAIRAEKAARAAAERAASEGRAAQPAAA